MTRLGTNPPGADADDAAAGNVEVLHGVDAIGRIDKAAAFDVQIHEVSDCL